MTPDYGSDAVVSAGVARDALAVRTCCDRREKVRDLVLRHERMFVMELCGPLTAMALGRMAMHAGRLQRPAVKSLVDEFEIVSLTMLDAMCAGYRDFLADFPGVDASAAPGLTRSSCRAGIAAFVLPRFSGLLDSLEAREQHLYEALGECSDQALDHLRDRVKQRDGKLLDAAECEFHWFGAAVWVALQAAYAQRIDESNSDILN